MRISLVLFLFAVSQAVTPTCLVADDLDPFQSSLRTVFAKHYPAVKVSTSDEILTFDHNSRRFQIHERRKNGEWQDAHEQRGPNKGGIYCEIASQEGDYQGAAVAPQTFDKHYFRVLLLAPYSKRLNRHLHVRLFYPADTTKEFLQEFTDAVNRFQTH